MYEKRTREVLTTSRTYPWSFGTQIFHSGQPSHGGDRKTFKILKVISWPDILTKSVEILLFILFI